MAKKDEQPDTRITITLPGEGGITRTGVIHAQRGDLAFFGEFQYAGQGDIADAIYGALLRLIDVEAAPPPDLDTANGGTEYKPVAAPPPEPKAKREPSAADPALKRTPAQTADERPPTDTRSPVGEAAQLSLF